MITHAKLPVWQAIKICPLLVFFLTVATSRGLTQVIPDSTLGSERSQVNVIDALNNRIDGGALRGGNLFHSFQRFDVETGRSVYFGDRGASNIFSRVTGSLPSKIDGTLGVHGSANLFFINPNGITFGSGAHLDLNGSFVATTASSVLFNKGGTFNASNSAASSILAVDVQAQIGLQFEGVPNSISVQGSGLPQVGSTIPFSVHSGNNIALVGGNLTVLGGNVTNNVTLKAPNGQIVLEAIKEAGTVEIDGVIPKQPDKLERADVFLGNVALLDTNDKDRGGMITIYGRNLNILQSKLAGNVVLSGLQSILLDGGSEVNGGNINIKTGSLNVRGGSQFNAKTSRTGNTGNILVQADDGISLEAGSKIFSGVSTAKSGDAGNIDAGNITVIAASLNITGGSEINAGTSDVGNAGNISIETSGRTFLGNKSGVFAGVSKGAKGNGGRIDITAGALEVSGESSINASVDGDLGKFKKGNAGSVFIRAQDHVLLAERSHVYTSISPGVKGNSGNITIAAGSLSITGLSGINSSLSGEGNSGSIFVQVPGLISLDGALDNERSTVIATVAPGGKGNSGNITIDSGSLRVTNGAQIINGNAGTESNQPGNIDIVSHDFVDLSNGGLISGGVDRSAEASRSGDISITARSVSVSNGAQIELKIFGETQKTGNIFIKASDSVFIDGYRKFNLDTGVITNVQQGGSATAGGITIQTAKLILKDNARITASTASGDGGNIDLKIRNLLFMQNSSQISTNAGTDEKDSSKGTGGNIFVNRNLQVPVEQDVKRGFIVAIPNQNNDITANSFSNRGGRVEISVQRVFGLTPRSRSDLENSWRAAHPGQEPKPSDLNPKDLSTSDITAISQSNPSLSGTVGLNTNFDPSQGLNQTPQEPRSTDVVDSCQVSNSKESVRFFDIGRGGLPPRPEDPLNVDLLEWSPSIRARISPKSSISDEISRMERLSPDHTSSFQASTATLRLLPPCQSH